MKYHHTATISKG